LLFVVSQQVRELWDYGGFDIRGAEFRAKTMDECAQGCVDYDGCYYFSRTKWGWCYLKTAEAGMCLFILLIAESDMCTH
jgi:hypothetical protein